MIENLDEYNAMAKKVNSDRKWVKTNHKKFSDIEPQWQVCQHVSVVTELPSPLLTNSLLQNPFHTEEEQPADEDNVDGADQSFEDFSDVGDSD